MEESKRGGDGFESWMRVTHLIPNVQQVSKSLPASGIMAGVRGSHECPQGMAGGVSEDFMSAPQGISSVR